MLHAAGQAEGLFPGGGGAGEKDGGEHALQHGDGGAGGDSLARGEGPGQMRGGLHHVQAVFPGQGGDLFGGDGHAGGLVQGLKAHQAAEPAGDLPEDAGAGQCLPGGLIGLEQLPGQVSGATGEGGRWARTGRGRLGRGKA